MLFKKKIRRCVGLDIGSGSIKAVELCSEQGVISVSGTRRLKLRAEGILGDEELSHSLSVWLEQSPWRDVDICVGLPQYLSTVQVRDFPVVVEDALRGMIAYETAQLSGISEERFIHDYHAMPAKFGRKNPVLIGISRFSVISERLNLLAAAGIMPCDLAMNSAAIVNALFFLRPEICYVDSPQMILEIGSENSIVVIFAGGQILSINSLLFGAEKFTRAIAEAKNLDLAKADEEKFRHKIDLSAKDDPIVKVSSVLVAEIKNAIEQWKNHESAELPEKDIVKIWLCGGGAQTGGLKEYLKMNFKSSQFEIFGPKESDGAPQPDLCTAFGLALQALGEAPIKISLTPEHIRWTARMKKNFHYLSTAIFFFVLSFFLLLLSHYLSLKMRDSLNRKNILRLKKCSDLIPEIKTVSEDISHHEKIILPFAAKGNNVPKILSALNELASAKEENISIVFLCDEESYKSMRPGTNQAEQPKISFIGQSKSDIDSNSPAASLSIQMLSSDVKEMNALILYGLTLSLGKNEHYESVRRFQSKLDKSMLFGAHGRDVDILPDDDSSTRDAILAQWLSQVLNNKDVFSTLGRMRFRDFAIRLPFEETCLNTPAIEGSRGGTKK